ncbi:TPA: hypothetical protein ACF373_003023 [Vibrio parahaemolyticus]
MYILNMVASLLTIVSFILTFDLIPNESIAVVMNLGMPERVAVFAILMFSSLTTISHAVQVFSKLSTVNFLAPVCILAVVNAYVVMKLAEVLVLSALAGDVQFLAFLAILFISIAFCIVSISGRLSSHNMFNNRGKNTFGVNCIFIGSMLVMYGVFGHSLNS